MAFSTLLALDRTASETLFRLGKSVPRPLWQLIEISGDGIFWLVITFAALSIPGVSLEKKTYIANFLLGLLLDLAETGLLKGIVRRNRPEYNLLAKDMRVVVNVDHYSFPSGHSSRVSFIFLFALFGNYIRGRISCIALASWVCIVAISRCIMGRHYFSDVVGGLLLGFITILLITKGSCQRDGYLVNERHTKLLMALVKDAMHGNFKFFKGF